MQKQVESPRSDASLHSEKVIDNPRHSLEMIPEEESRDSLVQSAVKIMPLT